MKSHLLQLLLPVAQSIHPEILANSIQLDRPKSIEHGDFSTNLAMMLAKPLKKNPRELAALIIEKLPHSSLQLLSRGGALQTLACSHTDQAPFIHTR